MFCSHCGKKIPDNAEFCSYCGERVVIENTLKTRSIASNVTGKNLYYYLKLKRTWICLAAMCVIVISSLVFITNQGEKDTAPLVYCTFDKDSYANDGCELFFKKTASDKDTISMNLPEGIDPDRLPVFLTSDSKTIYYFNDSNNPGSYSYYFKLYKISIPNTSEDKSQPIVVDDNIDCNCREPVLLNNDLLVYATYDKKNDKYSIKKYDGKKSELVIEVKKEGNIPDILTNRDKSAAYIRIRENNKHSWYQIDTKNNSKLKLICKDYYGISNLADIKTMIQNDFIIM